MADSSAYCSDCGTLSACHLGKVGYTLKHVGLAFSGAPFRFRAAHVRHSKFFSRVQKASFIHNYKLTDHTQIRHHMHHFYAFTRSLRCNEMRQEIQTQMQVLTQGQLQAHMEEQK